MGMYDNIVCKYPLPLPEDTKGYILESFQTKDLDCALDCYEIRDDGTLWLRECEREHIDGDPNGKTFSEKFGIIKEIKHWWTHVKTTRTISMYDYHHSDGAYDYFINFEVVFIDGVIDKIKLIEFDAMDNTERKKLHVRHIEELKKQKEFESTMFYKLIIKPYNKTIRFVTRHMSKFATFLLTFSYQIERKLTI